MPTAPRPALISLDLIEQPPHQLRLTIPEPDLVELADSMARIGLLEPIGVRPNPNALTFTIVYGHRRFLAARMLGWSDIPAHVREPNEDPVDLALAENLHRSPLTALEEAEALAVMRRKGFSHDRIAHIVKKSEAWVYARLELLAYPQDLRDAIQASALPLSVARELAAIDHEGYRVYLTRDAIAHGATQRTVNSWVQHYLSERPRVIANTEAVEQVAARRGDYVILVPCDYCDNKSPMETTRPWRLCHPCTTALMNARLTPT